MHRVGQGCYRPSRPVTGIAFHLQGHYGYHVILTT
jgi:hypothetical protein